jgi:TetR/AcrR family transcriptional regulator, fatty acid biosynthesis regulator
VQRAQAREQTRQRLLASALAILESGGEAALTTTAITRRAGISQSGFYNYFADMEDLLCHLIDEVEAQRRSAAGAARRAARQAGLGDGAVRESFRETVTRTAAHPNLFRLLVRSRLDPGSRVGAEARRQLATTRANFMRGLEQAGVPMATARERRIAGLIADGLVATFEGLLIDHLDGRYPDVEEILDALMLFARGVPAAARRHRPALAAGATAGPGGLRAGPGGLRAGPGGLRAGPGGLRVGQGGLAEQ